MLAHLKNLKSKKEEDYRDGQTQTWWWGHQHRRTSLTQIHPDRPDNDNLDHCDQFDDEDCDYDDGDDNVHFIIVMRIYILNIKGILYQRGI